MLNYRPVLVSFFVSSCVSYGVSYCVKVDGHIEKILARISATLFRVAFHDPRNLVGEPDLQPIVVLCQYIALFAGAYDVYFAVVDAPQKRRVLARRAHRVGQFVEIIGVGCCEATARHGDVGLSGQRVDGLCGGCLGA